MIVEHPSHRYAFQPKGKNAKSEGEGEKEGGLLSIFTSLLAEPLSRTNRSASDHLQIELVLHFVRNLLSIQPMTWSTEGRRENAKLAGELVVLLDKEMMLEVLVCVGQEVEKRENEGYNLLLMEILSYLLKGQVSTTALFTRGVLLHHSLIYCLHNTYLGSIRCGQVCHKTHQTSHSQPSLQTNQVQEEQTNTHHPNLQNHRFHLTPLSPSDRT